MSKITYIKDVDLMTEIDNYDTIVIGTNVYCTLSQGIQRDIALNYPYARNKNLSLKYGDVKRLGDFVACEDEGSPTIILAFIYKGYAYKPNKHTDVLEYESLARCLQKINEEYKGKTIATTLLGCSRFDGNGDPSKVKEIIDNTLVDVDVYVYDYMQKSRDEKQQETRKKELELKNISYELYYQAVKKRKELADKRFLKNGFARY